MLRLGVSTKFRGYKYWVKKWDRTEARPSDLGFHFPHQVQQFVQFCDLHSWTLLYFLSLLLLERREVHVGGKW